jgi:plasmid stabilization system protein ParE
MSRLIIFRPIARLELDEAMGWYERRKPGLGLELKESVGLTLARIVDSPDRFRPVRSEIRRALVGRFPYAIHFLAEPQAIIVLAVFHTRRDPSHLEGRA